MFIDFKGADGEIHSMRKELVLSVKEYIETSNNSRMIECMKNVKSKVIVAISAPHTPYNKGTTMVIPNTTIASQDTREQIMKQLTQ